MQKGHMDHHDYFVMELGLAASRPAEAFSNACSSVHQMRACLETVERLFHKGLGPCLEQLSHSFKAATGMGGVGEFKGDLGGYRR